MDKFITHAGQQPIFLGDIDFFDKAVRDTFARMVKAMTNGKENVILYGCEMTSTVVQGNKKTITWTDGIIMLKGEILPMPAGSVIVNTQKGSCYKIETTYDESGRRTMKSGEDVDCYEIRKATIIGYSDDPDGNCIVGDIKRLDEIYSDFVKTVNTEVIIANSDGDTMNGGNINFRLYKIGASYYINGTFEVTSSFNATNRFLYGITVRQPSVTEDDIKNLTTATMYPSGKTMFPITLFKENGNIYEYKVIPASVEIRQVSTPSRGISASIYLREDLEAGISGSFFTRLNTL